MVENARKKISYESHVEKVLERIGSKLIELRKKKGYTNLEDFARDHGLPRAQYWRMEKGKANLTIKSLGRLLEIHNLSFEEFFYTLSEKNK